MLRSFGSVIVILLSLTVLGSSVLCSAYAETQPTTRLVSVEYPKAVLPSATFQVKVNAWYSAAFLSDIGVWDVDSALMVQSMTFISQFTGPGNVSFALSLTAPKTPGPWHLLAINRVWWQNAWYQDPKGGEEPFTVSISNNVTLTFGSIGTAAQISVDGYPYEIQNGANVSVSLKNGAHVLAAPMIIPSGPGQRYVFVGWSDGVNSVSHSIFLTVPTAIYALYQTEYYLSAQSDVGQITGGGWYPNGTEATVAVTPTAVTNQSGLTNNYQFAGWSGASDSASNVIALRMDGPKQVKANWALLPGPVINSNLLTVGLLLCCLPLLGRLAFLRLRHRGNAGRIRPGVAKGRGSLIIVLAVLLLPLVFPAAHAQSLPQPRASVVRIGDAEWYYWGHPGSDTCLIWLGGGVPAQAEPGSYAYFINPFDYESFDTIRFIQDLTNYYCVIALQQGSAQWFNPAANRTIYQELFQPQSTTLEAVHTWIAGQGYAHTFVVGYSVGGQAAIADLTLTHPEDWTTEDGIILITVPFSQDVLNNAKELRANLFIIYGGNLLDYEVTGVQFYNNTQPEGSGTGGYFHKEFHVIDDVGHEAWTVRATGAYDRRALNLIIGFIEKSKTLQVTRGLSLPTDSTGSMVATVLSVQAPLRVSPGEGFVVQSNVSLKASAPKSMILAAYTQNGAGILSEVSLKDGSLVAASIVIPPISKNMNLVLSVGVFRNSSGNWVRASNVYSTTLTISDLDTLTVRTSSPSVSFWFDGAQYATNSSGLVEIQTVAGQHTIMAQSFIYLSNVSRLRFLGWEDSTSELSRQISLDRDETIGISYVQQYLVEVNSPYGQTDGSGWYDANSSALALVQPPVLTSPPVIFAHWASQSNQSEVGLLFTVTSPQLVSAVWDTANTAPPPRQTVLDPMVILSTLALIILVILNIRSRPSGRNGRSPKAV